jgi:hypothetical protein
MASKAALRVGTHSAELPAGSDASYATMSQYAALVAKLQRRAYVNGEKEATSQAGKTFIKWMDR